MDKFIQRIKKSPKVYYIRKNFKMYLSDIDINLDEIKQDESSEQKDDVNVQEIDEKVQEKLNFYLFQKMVSFNKAFSIFQDIYFKLNKHRVGINPDQVKLKFKINEVSSDPQQNYSWMQKPTIDSDDVLQLLSQQISTDFVWQCTQDYKLELTSPFYIKKISNAAYINLNIRDSYEKTQIICYECPESLYNSSKLQDLSEYNTQLQIQQLLIVIPTLTVYFEYNITCECCPDVFRFEELEDYGNPINISQYSNIMFENIVISGAISMYNENFHVKVQINKYLKSIIVNDNVLRYMKFTIEDDSYLNMVQINVSRYPNSIHILKPLPISEIEFITPNFNLQHYNEVSELPQLVRIQTNQSDNQYVDILSKKYSDFLSIITIDKLFQGSFSIFRILYDIYQ